MGIKTIVILAAILIFGHIIGVIIWLYLKIKKNAEKDALRRKQNQQSNTS